MGKRQVYNKLRIKEPHRRQISGFSGRNGRVIYQGQVRRALANYGYPSKPVAVADPDVLGRIATWANDKSFVIQREYNRRLLQAVNKLDPSLSDAEMIDALAPFFAATKAYNDAVLLPHASRTLRAMADRDFIDKNSMDVQVSVDPPLTVAGSCPTCIEAIAKSPMSLEESDQYDMPAHERCFHAKVFLPVEGSTLPAVTAVWPLAQQQEAAAS